MIRCPLLVLVLLPGVCRAGVSADYTLEPLASATGGESAASADYSLTASTTPGGHGASAGYVARTGFAGQLGVPSGLIISSPAPALAEGSSTQLTADLLYDDGSQHPLGPSAVAWSISSGPVDSISPTGLAIAAAVYQDTPAIVRGSMGAYSRDLDLTIIDSFPDNFGTYAADGLPDLWQIEYFGIGAPKAGKFDDFDGDETGNLIEFANGTDPSSPASGPQFLVFENNTLIRPGQPLVNYSPAPNSLPYRVVFVRRKGAGAYVDYAPQFSAQLESWSNATTPVTVVSDDGSFELVSVRFPVLIGGLRSSSKFFRLKLSPTP